MTVFMKCPRCNSYMTPNLDYTNIEWRCSCGYSSNNTSIVINDSSNPVSIKSTNELNKMRTKKEYQEALDEMYRDARLLNLGSGCYATPETDKQKSKLQELIDNLKENK